jgi:hypothetical protein
VTTQPGNGQLAGHQHLPVWMSLSFFIRVTDDTVETS